MAVVYEHLVPHFPLGWGYTRFVVASLAPRWHVHPEFELTWIVRGHGTRLIGDSVEPYAPGDLVVVGPELAHTYASLPNGGTTEAVVIHFTRDFLGANVFERPAFALTASMLDRSSRGLRFPRIPGALSSLDELAPAERTVKLLETLVDLSRQEYVCLATGRPSLGVTSASADRLEAMVAFVHEHFDEPISARDVAQAAFMNASAASRLFARSTRLTISRYINVIRVNAACRLLRESDFPVARIAGSCGFVNLSNFNRRFREVKECTPREYRSFFHTGPVADPVR